MVSSRESESTHTSHRATIAVGGVAALLGILLLSVSGRYGFHRDELYFLEAGRHPAAGYVDQPPITPLLARLSVTLFGETPTGLRIVSILMAVATVVVVAWIAAEFGGGTAARIGAALGASAMTYNLVVGGMMSTSTFDLLAWVVVCWLVLRALRTGDNRWFLAIGVATGITLLNKNLILLLLAAIAAAILIAGRRDVLRSGWLWIGIAVALLLWSPNLIWQATHGWPQVTVAGGISGDDGPENRLLLLPMQLVYAGPLLAPVWIAGLIRLWRDSTLRWARPIVVAYPILLLLTFAVGGKGYYPIPLLCVFVAAGVAPILGWMRRGRIRAIAGGLAYAAALLSSVVVALPTLPVAALAASPIPAMNRETSEQVGWPELVSTVGTVWRRIPAADRAKAVIFTGNYGEAGAIIAHGAQRGLPQPYSGHMSFYDWGPPPNSATGPVLLVLTADSPPPSPTAFRDCRVAARHDNGLGLDNDEQGAAVWRCAGTRGPWSEIWPTLRRYY